MRHIITACLLAAAGTAHGGPAQLRLCGLELMQTVGAEPNEELVELILDQSRVTDRLPILIITAIESGFNTAAHSDKDAIGLLQVTKPAAQEVIAISAQYKQEMSEMVLSEAERRKHEQWLAHCDLPKPTAKRLRDPGMSVRYGSCYFEYLLSVTNHNIPLALAAYNGGYRQMSKLEGRQPLANETSGYIAQYYYLKESLTCLTDS